MWLACKIESDYQIQKAVSLPCLVCASSSFDSVQRITTSVQYKVIYEKLCQTCLCI